jgi:hypothetical protein
MANSTEKIGIFTWLQWLVLRLSFIEVLPIEVKKRRYYPSKIIEFADVHLSEEETKDQFQKALFTFQLEQKRRDTLTDKVKTLLSLGTFSLTFNVALFNLIELHFNLLSLVVIIGISITISILLCLNFLSINTLSTPSFNSVNDDCNNIERYSLNTETKISDHLKEIIYCCDFNHRGTDFLADIYRAAQRYFIVSLICIVLMLIIQPLKTKEKASNNNTYIFNSLQSSDNIIDEIHIEFAFDKYTISETESQKLYSQLEKYKNGYDFSIVGYADESGVNLHNDRLSEMRAGSMAKWLVTKLNVSPKRITIMGGGVTGKYGIVNNSHENRRAVVFIHRAT